MDSRQSRAFTGPRPNRIRHARRLARHHHANDNQSHYQRRNHPRGHRHPIARRRFGSKDRRLPCATPRIACLIDIAHIAEILYFCRKIFRQRGPASRLSFIFREIFILKRNLQVHHHVRNSIYFFIRRSTWTPQMKNCYSPRQSRNSKR